MEEFDGGDGDLLLDGDVCGAAVCRSERAERKKSSDPAGKDGCESFSRTVHPHPEQALCDGPQALFGESLTELSKVMATFPALLGRTQNQR